MEQNINGALDTAYVYGAAIGTGSDRLSLDRFEGSTSYYLYDARGSVTGLTNEEGQIYQSYRYSVFGEITFGASQYEDEYTYNGESYNPNIKSQYLRARYYCVVTADFLTEDSYLGNITEPLTLNRYNYCLGNPLNYADPSGHIPEWLKNILDFLFGDDGEEPTLPVAYPIPPTPTPKPTEVPVILPDGVEPYEQGVLPKGGIAYMLEAVRRQTEKNNTYLLDGYLNQQVKNAEDNSTTEYIGGDDIMSKPDTPLYKYTEENVNNIVTLDSKFDVERDDFKTAYEKNIERYKELAEEVGVPPELIAVIHYRENSKDYLDGSFNVYLHNGEQLGKTTVKVPKGIYFEDFNLAAYDAIRKKEKYIEKYNLTSDSKDIVAMMCFAEVYNGLGYHNNDHISPYLYSGTHLYVSGKYVEEKNAEGKYISVYKKDVVDAQIGVYILLNSILDQEVE